MSTQTAWWTYVQGQLKRRSWLPADLARAANVSNTTINRWSSKGNQPGLDTVRAVARAFDVPVLEALVEGGLLTPEEAGAELRASERLDVFSDEELAAEVLNRMQRGHAPQPAGLPTISVEEIAANPERYQVVLLPTDTGGDAAHTRPGS